MTVTKDDVAVMPPAVFNANFEVYKTEAGERMNALKKLLGITELPVAQPSAPSLVAQPKRRGPKTKEEKQREEELSRELAKLRKMSVRNRQVYLAELEERGVRFNQEQLDALEDDVELIDDDDDVEIAAE